MELNTKFIVASDLHYIAEELTDHGEYFEEMIMSADGKAMNDCGLIVDHFIKDVIAEKPEAVVITGDLTFNGAQASHEELSLILKRIEEQGIQVLVIPGNHDVDNRQAASFKEDSYSFVRTVDGDEFCEIWKDYGYTGAYSYDEDSASYVWELKSGMRFLMIDASIGEQYLSLSKDTLKWIEKQLRDAEESGHPVISFSHQNLYAHSIMESGFVIENADEVLKLLKQYNVPLHFSGHMHIQHYMQDTVSEIASSSLMVSPYQYGMIEVDGKDISYACRQVSEIPEEVLRFFRDVSAEKHRNIGSSREAEYFADLNSAYFSGNLKNVQVDPEISADLPEGFMKKYVLSMEAEAGRSYTELNTEWK